MAKERIAPLVRKMDEEATTDPSVLEALFSNGVCRLKILCSKYDLINNVLLIFGLFS